MPCIAVKTLIWVPLNPQHPIILWGFFLFFLLFSHLELSRVVVVLLRGLSPDYKMVAPTFVLQTICFYLTNVVVPEFSISRHTESQPE